MRGIADEALLLLEAFLQAIKHAVERTCELRQLIAGAWHIQTPSETFHLDAARRPGDLADGFQDASADEMTCKECEHKASGDCVEEQSLQGIEKVRFRCDRAEEMDLIGNTVVLNVAPRMIDGTALELGDLHIGICPDRRRDSAALDRLNRGEMRVRIEYNAPRTICNTYDDTRDNGPLEPEFCLCRIAAFDIAHHVAYTAVEIDLRLPIKIDVRANPQNRRRENEYEKEDCRVQQGNLR